ncbi:SIR2 family protein [Granulosicoccus antarcticus]|uniref:Novel STAND NTPase 5 domain-containing protein n=1 Tax=Granulosicoccus antarcticus IMCC3135 TaxID=1192854 RepID=A0A2Z2NTM1_9GAMM|nr:SIR2 family protein [Granulosicoccus antarcticus]ASJ72100.1 hypothetical protein IMCC3135_10030 [Granulosicoccus antarcticus IMCC3135]
MPTDLNEVARRINPEETILFLGAGASVPSGAPKAQELSQAIAAQFSFELSDYSLSEVASIAEEKVGRRSLVEFVNSKIGKLRPTRGLRNIPLFDWRRIYTTNYDDLIESAYRDSDTVLQVVSSNYEITNASRESATTLYKIHGTVGSDTSTGQTSKLILTEQDYDDTQTYREALYSQLERDLVQGSCVIIGYSLSDAYMKEQINFALKVRSKSDIPGQIYLITYASDAGRAMLYEKRGFVVANGSIDDFIAAMANETDMRSIVYSAGGDPLNRAPRLRVSTVVVEHELAQNKQSLPSMFAGWPANYSDIEAGHTFERDAISELANELIEKKCAVIVGASGTGKTTAARQVLYKLEKESFVCWEHFSSHQLPVDDWIEVSQALVSEDRRGVLFVDDAHEHLRELNRLADRLSTNETSGLMLVVAAPANLWNPRVKSTWLTRNAARKTFSRLTSNEIDKLISLAENLPDLRPLLESSFAGFSREDRKRRLQHKCESETFVCLRNIFSSDSFDNIVLREYASLPEDLQELYKTLSALQASGVSVHRQLLIRMLGIDSSSILAILARLDGIVEEYTVSAKDGTYGWRGRHDEITRIIYQYKFQSPVEREELVEKVVDNLVATDAFERKTVSRLCSFEAGIQQISSKSKRDRLLRKLISKVPSERLPRHRLIRSLMDQGKFDETEAEIRVYKSELHRDTTIQRYEIMLGIRRAMNSTGIMQEDRRAIALTAYEASVRLSEAQPLNKNVLKTRYDAASALVEFGGSTDVLHDAMVALRKAERETGDPDVINLIFRLEKEVLAISENDVEVSEVMPESEAMSQEIVSN